MTANTLPDHLILQLKHSGGSSYRNAIIFREDDAQNFITLEYDMVTIMLSKHNSDYRVLSQELVITRMHQVFDVLTIELQPAECDTKTIKLYFDIGKVFGKCPARNQ
jgi:hypothetical protein